jgi:hypothetical protein
MVKSKKWPVCGSASETLRHSAVSAYIICFARIFPLYRRNKGKQLPWRRLPAPPFQKLLIPIKFQIQTNDNPSKEQVYQPFTCTGIICVGSSCLFSVSVMLCYLCRCHISCVRRAHAVSVNSSPLTETDFERTVVKGARFSILANKIREPGCFNKWLPQLPSISDGVHILSRLAQLMVITGYNFHAGYLQLYT